MSKSSKTTVVSGLTGSCLLVMNACVCVTLAGEPTVVKSDVLADSHPLSSLRSELLLGSRNVDDTKLDKNILLAQAGVVSGTAGIFVLANSAGASVGVSQEFSSWSDLTAVFRPSRWKNPFSEGGSLSWLNYKAWGNVPGRTAKVLLGEVIVVGATYAIIDASSGDGHDDAETTTPVASSTSSARASNDESASSTTTAPAEESSTPATPVPPAPPAPPAGGETPF
ncbi:MAG: hypothetical protein A2283_04430 [Lentisphaerae bacterium RIFOXYA12_FULL_48_11]|nr:MAG: hypothetical protein A2283_04430 [Lentisphaerae bacterium RIFOXYA12_FULL_48_11]